jgi:hypothetical protein
LDITGDESLPIRYRECIDGIVEAMGKGSGIAFTFKYGDGVAKCSVPVTPGPDNSPVGGRKVSNMVQRNNNRQWWKI